MKGSVEKMKKIAFWVFVVAVAGSATLPAATVTTEGTVLTIDVGADEAYTNSTALASPITEVVKTGAGTAVFTAAAPNFTGTINVNAGTAEFTVRDAYGAGPINVADGAAMVVSHASAGQTALCVRGTVTIAGDGPDGTGALRFTGTGLGDQMFQNVTLSADATWGATRCGALTVDFGGHVLTWKSGNLMALSSHWRNFGGLVSESSSTITFQSAPTFDASCTNGLITLVGSGGISFWDISVKIPFSLKVESSAGIADNAGSGEWAGPIEVASGGELRLYTGSANRTLTVSGAVTGDGAMRLTGTSSIVLSAATNSIAGDLVVTNGTVTLDIPTDTSLEVAGALRGNGTLKKTGMGRLLVHSASPDFTGSIDAVAGLVAFDGTQNETLPNATSLRNVSFAQGGMVSINGTYTAAAYVSDGLVLHYDGIENAGLGLSDLSTSISTWKNLAASGAACDVSLPSWVTPRMNSFYSAVASTSTKTGSPTIDTVSGLSNTGTGPITLEVVMCNAGWRYTDNYNNLQSVVGTPYGTVGYRYSAYDGHYFQTLANSSQTHLYNLWLGISAATTHTYTAQLGVESPNFWVDGTSMKSKGNWGQNDYTANRRSSFIFFHNPRADIRVYAIRVYNRALTANERAANRALDALRFQGTALPASLLLVTSDVPSQTWDGVHDVCPRPVVSNLITRAQLVQGRDYALVYSANAAPGTGSVKVVGIGDYAGLSTTKSFAITRGFTAELAAGADGAATATLAFPASGRARALYVAGSDRDAGGLTNGWDAVARLADVPAGATSLSGVALPAAASGWMFMRFFLAEPAASDCYVTDGLALHLDGIDNTLTAGVRSHAADATVLSDLTGNGNDVAVPSFASVTDNAVFSPPALDKGTAGLYTKLTAVAGVDTPPSRLTTEMAARRGAWQYTDNYGNHQTVFTTPLGNTSYRDGYSDGFGVAYRDRNGNNLGTRSYTWRPSGARVSDLHTTAARLEVGGASFAIDGKVSDGQFSNHWFENSSMSSEYRFFSNLRADITAHAIRLYNRKLTEEELARNARLDAIRFGGGGEVLAASVCLANPCAVAAKIRNSPGGAVADVAYAPLDADRSLYVAWGAEDGGATTGGWANVARVATLAAGTTSARGVLLPAGAVPSRAGRFFLLEDLYDSSSYVTNGLVLQYDGVDNTLANGVRSHDAAPTVWSDLTGRGRDVTLPAYVTVEANAMFSPADKTKASVSVEVPEVTTSATHVVTVDVAAQRGAWRYSDNYFNLQEAFATPFGSVGYRMNEGWIYVLHPTDAAKLALSQFKDYTATITKPHTIAATLGVDDAGSWIDGASHALGVNDSYTTVFSSSCRIFSNPRADLRLFAVRLYNRKLSDAELKWNARVDAGRFLGAPAFSVSEPMKLYPPGFMLIFR